MKRKSASTYLIIFAFVLLCLGFVMAFFIYRTVENLKYDAKIINQTGIIRGSIQRLVKLELSGSDGSNDNLVQKIDRLIDNFLLMKEGYQHNGAGQELSKNIHALKNNWQDLKANLIEFRSNQSETKRKQIIRKSEICWETADAAVYAAQIATEDKVAGIKLFYSIILLNVLNTLFVIWLIYTFVRKKLEYQASYDSLTGLLNRYSYDYEIKKEISRSRRYNRVMSLLLFDIDRFKEINDNYGHKQGDRVLSDLASLVKNSVRKTDSVFRVGGEEFAIIAPETGGNYASKMAEKIRRGVEKHSFSGIRQVTISLGIAELVRNTTDTDLFRQADQALYQAKNGGRTCVKVFANE